MATKISSKQKQELHAAVDELASANPELAVSLLTIMNAMMQSETAVVVPKKGGKKSKPVEDEDEDLVEADEDDVSEDEDDDLAEDDEDDAPKKGKGKSSAKASTSAKKGGKKAPVVEEEDDEDAEEGDDDDGAVVDIEDIEAQTIADAYEECDTDDKHERIETTGIKELAAEVDEFGYDVAQLYKAAKASSTAEKKAVLVNFLSRVYFTIDAIMAFEMDDVVAKVEELTEEDFKPTGRSKAAKELSAATALFKAATDAVA
jgi:hypothetical protein